MKEHKRYNAIGAHLKEEFGFKVIKLSIDGGFTCPNRDGTLSTEGCIFCSEEGSGDFAAPAFLTIDQQIRQQIELLKNKWPEGKYIAYFQKYTNTYADLQILKEKLESPLTNPSITGIAIATRPDCLPSEVIQLLKALNEKTYLWVELGLQTIHEKSAELINRQYPLSTFEKALSDLNAANIRTVVHLIMGIPFETKEKMLESVAYIASKNIFGIKLHLLHILENTRLAELYRKGTFNTLEKQEYIDLICDALEMIPKDVTIHRLTGDAPRKLLIAPKWSADKRSVLNGINMELKRRNSYQGKNYSPSLPSL